jgi:hypothetical protein
MAITLATVDYGSQERYEALYADGVLLKRADDGPLSAAEVLEAIATTNIAVQVAYVEVDPDFDQEVISNEGWPERLADVKTRDEG